MKAKNEEQRIAYFSYGSNTNVREYFERTGSALPPPVCIAMLPDRELAFTYDSVGRKGGVLDVRPKLGGVVYGAVHLIGSAELDVLDRKEGRPYARREAWAYTPGAKRIRVVFYEVKDEYRQVFVRPSDAYVKAVAQGYRQVGLSLSPLRAAAHNEPLSVTMPLLTFGRLAVGGDLFPHVQFLTDEVSVPMEAFGEQYAWRGQILTKIGSRRRNLVAAHGRILHENSEALVRLDRMLAALPADSTKAGIYRTPIWAATVERGRVYDAWCYVWWGRMPSGATKVQSCKVGMKGLSEEVAVVH